MLIPTLEKYRHQLTKSSLSGGFLTENTPQNDLDNLSPLVSIITVVYNGENSLEATIQSVINQSYSPLEYIIIDGGSTDNTLSIIEQYETQISRWISEPDQGLYDAMNKGIACSKGEIIGLLNAGDQYLEDTVSEVVKNISINHPVIVTGDCQVLLKNSSKWIIESGQPQKLPRQMIPHSSVFVSRYIYENQGLLDLNFKIAADYDFLCRCYQQSVPFIYINQILSVASPRGVSSNYYLAEIEFTKIRLFYTLIPKFECFKIGLLSLLSISIHQFLKYVKLWDYIEEKRHGSIR